MSETEILSVPLDAEMKREADKIFGEFGVTTASGTAGFLNGQYQVQVSPFLNGMRIIYKDPIITRCFQNGAIGM